jgi:hypothetical protein
MSGRGSPSGNCSHSSEGVVELSAAATVTGAPDPASADGAATPTAGRASSATAATVRHELRESMLITGW